MNNHTYFTEEPKEEISTKKKVATGCLTLFKYLVGIIFVGFLINLGMEKKEEYDNKYPWYGSIWYGTADSKSIFDDKQFKTLEECREWAKKHEESKNLKEGQWDYSCGTNCSFSDQGISNGRKINTFECSVLTK
jgi:hypothetical protein